MTQKNKRIPKGQWGYLKEEKKRRLKRLCIFIMIGIFIFVLGLLLNKGENTNIFTVIAVLFVLPATREFIGFFVLFPFRALKMDRYESLKQAAGADNQCYFDVAFTSPEKVMFAEMIVISENEIMILAEKKSDLCSYIETYIKKGFEARKLNYKVFVTSDEKKYIKEVGSAQPLTEHNEEAEEYIESLMI